MSRTYDEWKTTNPQDEYLGEPDNPDCICTHRRHKFCPVHGIDPDYALDQLRDQRMEDKLP
jgi:hypothetical protein